MTSKRLSPAANLLRNSRLMAMPTPIPTPASHNIYSPPPAPYPTMQAIATPPACHARGEWGLKRDLPLKTKNIYIRYRDLDTLEHFTTFESAHDDVLTLKKWQQMDVPLTKSPFLDRSESFARAPETVFDGKDVGQPESYQWRYKAPLLSSMTSGELNTFIKKHVKHRRAEFALFVTKEARRKEFMEKCRFQDIAPPVSEPDATENLTESNPADLISLRNAELDGIENLTESNPADLISLRNDPLELQRMVIRFLDLPTETAPYRVHPSAGLHYTRSAAHMTHDAVHGPQQGARPVLGRYLNFDTRTGLLVGVGGVVAKVDDSLTSYRGSLRDVDRFATSHYAPARAFIDNNGRIIFQVLPAVPYGPESKYFGNQSNTEGLRGFVPSVGTGWGDAGARAKMPPALSALTAAADTFTNAQRGRSFGFRGRTGGNGEAADAIAGLYKTNGIGPRR